MKTFGLRILVSSLAASCVPSLSLAQSSSNSNGTAAAVFVSPGTDIAFALNVPSDSTTDLYFSLMIPIRITYGAIAIGGDQMAGTLNFVAYGSANGKNITLSPRIAYGHSEPQYSSDIKIQALAGTGLINETTYVFNGKCSNCRSWSNGKIDVTSTSQYCLYATGPDGDINSDDFNAPLKIHYNFGTFTMDMVRATGPGGVPSLPTGKTLIGTTVKLSKSGKTDVAAMLHAVVMVLIFVGLLPFGTLVLRLGGFVRWHGINQGFALLLMIIGAGLGVYISLSYNRSRKFNTAHQILGILVFLFFIAQFVLGYMHHRIFKQTQQTTKLAPVHVWLGRLIIILGVITAFLGFPLALTPFWNYVLAGLVAFVFPVCIIMLLTKNFIRRKWNKSKGTGEHGGYNLEPWREGSGATGHATTITGGVAPDMRSYSNYHGRSDGRTDLGPQQSARDYV